MAVLKCKMCGGNLHITDDMKIVECEFCGTMQTIPDGNDEKKTNLFNRANRLRSAAEFDHAAGVYESIIAEFPNEAEAYWGLCLCKYGIEYVDDPKTGLRIPTCHRTSFESIFSDSNYKLAIANADISAKAIYEKEATVIDGIQKDILRIANNEKPFDVFICYKETDEKGNRTQDSVIAQDIYDELTEKGFKVFFSRITLESKLGQEYEPYIFAALNSAKVMLAIGTKADYYNAVWVKNEWSRYLSLMNSDRSKTLIPCYKDIDPYDMPVEFKNIQGQDMSKLGFMQDLVRGIRKLTGKIDGTTTEKVVVSADYSMTEPLIKRMFIFLEDGKFDIAAEYPEKILDMDLENPTAFLDKLMVELKCRKVEDLQYTETIWQDNTNYIKFKQYANTELAAEIESYNRIVIEKVQKADRVRKEKSAKTKKKIIQVCATVIVAVIIYNLLGYFSTTTKYKKALNLAETGEYTQALTIMNDISDYKDMRTKISETEELYREELYKKASALYEACNYEKVIELLSEVEITLSPKLNDLISDSEKGIEYEKAKECFSQGKYEEAYNIYETLRYYKDSLSKLEEIKYILEPSINVVAGQYSSAQNTAWVELYPKQVNKSAKCYIYKSRYSNRVNADQGNYYYDAENKCYVMEFYFAYGSKLTYTFILDNDTLVLKCNDSNTSTLNGTYYRVQ